MNDHSARATTSKSTVSKTAASHGTVFVTGATGYIGGRLVPRLLDTGYAVRCLARDRRKVEARPWAHAPHVEIVEGDLNDPAALAMQMNGCTAAYYLIHSMMIAGRDYGVRDRTLAQRFSVAAETAKVQRIIYLGGLGESGDGLSEHLASRREVETALADSSVPITVLRAAMIIGSGSASFEILRYLVERLPVMVTPRWVKTESQPIAVHNVLHYLVACLDTPATSGATLDIGGPDVVSYHDLMHLMAQTRGLPRRLVVPVPVLTPRLSSIWIHLITPLSSGIARPLAEGLRNRVVCRDNLAAHLMPQRLSGVREAIEAALGRHRSGEVETSWSDAGAIPGDPDWSGGTTFMDRRELAVHASAKATFRAVCRIGGGNGWYAADALWRLRGFLDRLVGGPGLRRGRRHPDAVFYGDALDFWRVTDVEPDRRLTLRAEMKLPGEALLEFHIAPIPQRPGWCLLRQIARFQPRGLAGLLYWYAILPLHGFVFRGMLRGIQRTAEEPNRSESATSKDDEGIANRPAPKSNGTRTAPAEDGPGD